MLSHLNEHDEESMSITKIDIKFPIIDNTQRSIQLIHYEHCYHLMHSYHILVPQLPDKPHQWVLVKVTICHKTKKCSHRLEAPMPLSIALLYSPVNSLSSRHTVVDYWLVQDMADDDDWQFEGDQINAPI